LWGLKLCAAAACRRAPLPALLTHDRPTPPCAAPAGGLSEHLLPEELPSIPENMQLDEDGSGGGVEEEDAGEDGDLREASSGSSGGAEAAGLPLRPQQQQQQPPRLEQLRQEAGGRDGDTSMGEVRDTDGAWVAPTLGG
jgi:hypothetical protein